MTDTTGLGPSPGKSPGPPLPAREAHTVLTEGDLQVQGRIMPASNVTLLAEVSCAGTTLPCVYKPTAGERPLWDFPDHTLAAREVAAYVVSEALGWDIVPLTVLRDGPAGAGMVQLWCEPDPGQDAVDLVPEGEVPDGWLHVLDATDHRDEPVSLVHEDSVPLRRMAVFDVLVNNADRKGGHVLPMADGHRYGVDHGVCFHQDVKLRTVLWGWAGAPLAAQDRPPVAELRDRLTRPADPLTVRLRELLSEPEVAAVRARATRLLARGRMPVPSGHWPAIPWPAF